jgi:group I intron endonuclease
MKKDIYKITNLINNKIYIGQSVNTKHRWEQHISSSKHNPKTIVDRAINKYGQENFKYEIIENTSDYDDREKYWINYYNATDRAVGYNVAVGGRSVGCGIKHPNSKIKDQDTLNKIIDAIRNSKLNFETISKIFNVTPVSISEINNGISYKQSDLEYPLREEKYTEEFYKRLVYSIKYESDKSLKDIAKEYDLDLSYVIEINTGVSRWRSYLNYPLRDSFCHRSGYKVYDDVVYDLLNTQLQQKDIARKHNVSCSVVSQINTGETYKQNNMSYPIRQNKQSTQKKRTLSPNEVKKVFDELIQTKKSCSQIAEELCCHPSTVRGINNGEIIKYRNEEFTYPLRKFKTPVSTIRVWRSRVAIDTQFEMIVPPSRGGGKK